MRRAAGLMLIEWLVVLAILLVVLRIVFASTLGAYERQLFAQLGVNDEARILLSIPLLALYLRYGRERLNDSVPSWLVGGGIGVIVFGIGAIAWLFIA